MWSAAILVLAAAPSLPPDPEPWPWTIAWRPTDDPTVRALQQDLIDSARWGKVGARERLGTAVLRQARAAGKATDILCLHEAYLRHFPFGGSVDWSDAPPSPGALSPQAEWQAAADQYFALLAWTEKPPGRWFHQSRSAAQPFAELRAAYRRKDVAEYLRLADQILAEYPKSLYAQAAVLTACWGRTIDGHGRQFAGPELVLEYHEKMVRAGVPEDGRLPVLIFYRQRLKATGRPVEDWVERDLRTAKRPLLRRAIWAEEIDARVAGKDWPAAREAVRRYLDTYPEGHKAEPRLRLVLSAVRAGAADEALRWFSDMKRMMPPFAVGDALAVLADDVSVLGRWDLAITAYEEAIRDDPRGVRTPGKRLSLAHAYGRDGDETKMVALYKELAADPRNPTDQDMSARNRAREALGDHFTRKREWKEALRWWEVWKPLSGCGTCQEGMERKKQHRIAECRKALDER